MKSWASSQESTSTATLPQRDLATPGKRALTDAMTAPVQRRADGPGDRTGGDARSIAARGTSGAGTALPHLDTIQRSFGRHDLSGVQAHVGGAAAAAARDLGAVAYATGNHVAFAAPPDLHTAAHEVAHVVQQRAGVYLKDGLGDSGDIYERNADAVADRVVAGRSAEDLLPPVTGAAPTAGSAVQRLNGAAPQNFRVTAVTRDDARCAVTTDLAWDSSNANPADLADFQSREHVTFNANPAVAIPAYGNAAVLPAGMVIAGNILTKNVGVMSNPGGSDTHSGAALGPKFTVGGIANLQRAAWTLIGTQYYQTSQAGGPWANIAGPFTITRTMTQTAGPNGEPQYSLVITKTGPGCVVSAGPTPIHVETSTAIAAVGGARGDQTGEWNTANATFTAQGLATIALGQDVQNNATGTAITVDYEHTAPINPHGPFAAAQTIPAPWLATILARARAAATTVITDALSGAHPPTRFRFTIFRCNGVQQQAFWTNENGGTYRVILRADKLMDMTQWGGDRDTSMAGRESKRAFRNDNKRGRFAQAVATHELGHMLHAHASPDSFLTATMMPAMIPAVLAAVPADPLAEDKVHIATVNGQVMAALAAKNYKQKWGYALANPGEVVPEVFAAIMHGRNVPKGLAAVYVAYGGQRSATIDAALQTSFGGAIPAIAEPEDCIAIINS